MPLMLEHFFYPDRMLILQCYHAWGVCLLPLIHGKSQASPRHWLCFCFFFSCRFPSMPCPVSASPSYPNIPIKRCISVAQCKSLKAMMVLCADGVVKQEACLPLLPRPGGLEVPPAPEFSSGSCIKPQREQILLTDSSLLLVLMSERLHLLHP